MFHLYEFEVFESDDGWFIAAPFDWDGATQGETLEEACVMAADWLRIMCEDAAIHDYELPEPTFGNEPLNGGRVLLVGIEAGLETVRKVGASEAARMLGVTPGRVTQMIEACLLEGWREGHRTWVTLDSVEARLAENPGAGRPRKDLDEG